MANPNIVGVSTITLENSLTNISSETTTTILSAVSTGSVVRLKEVRVSENSALPAAPTGSPPESTVDDDNPLYVTLNYDNGTAYPIVSKHHIPLCSTAVIFSGVFHVKEGHSLTITTGDDDTSSVDVTVAVTYEVLS